MKTTVITTLLALSALILVTHNSSAQITATPVGFVIAAEQGDTLIEQMRLSNLSDAELDWRIKFELPAERDNRLQGPQRDNPGDIIVRYQMRYANTIALAWDPDREWMWGVNHENPPRLVAYNPAAQRTEIDVEIPNNAGGMFYLNGVLFLDGRNPSRREIYRYAANGQRLESLQTPFDLFETCFDSDGERLYIQFWQGGPMQIYNLANWERIASIDYAGAVQNATIYTMAWVPQHPRGQLWLYGNGLMHQLHVDDDWNCERVQSFRTIDGRWAGLEHDGYDLWLGVFRGDGYWYKMDDGVTESYWLQSNPMEGTIAGGESVDIDVLFIPGEIEAGTYEMLLGILLENNRNPTLQMSCVLTVGEEVTDVVGQVTDARTGEPIEGATATLDRFIFARNSDEDGNYRLLNLPLGDYTLTYTAPDYLRTSEDLNIDEGGQIRLDIEMLHATCTPDVEEIFTQLVPDSETDITFGITNTGNGPLTYHTERRLLGDANAEPWTIRRSYNSGQVLNDDRLEGAVFDGERFYVCGAAGNEPNTIYILNREGELVDQFDQPGESVYGMKDLEWDGELIWGSGESRVFGFTTEGEIAVEFQGPYNPNTVIAYDSLNDLLWIAATTNDIAAYDREGNRVQRTLSRKGFRLYGLAYWPDDPDDYPLYVFHSPAANDVRVHKMNPERNGDTLFVRQLYTDGGVAPGGASITNQYDVYSWVMIAVANIPRNDGSDRIDIFQLDARKDWFVLEPVEGVIEAGEEQEFTLHLNSTGLPTVTFEGELAYYHDGVGSLTRIPVTLDVVEGRVNTFRDISLDQGWNLVSTNLQPENEDVTVITRPLVNAGQLLLMKNGFGQFYAPGVGFNNIPGWFAPQGYWMKLTDAAVLRVTGESVLADDPIELTRGWNLIAYYPRRVVEAPTALSGIIDHLLIAKDGFGSFYVPAWGFNNMAPLQEGRGYQLKVDEDIELVYRTGQIQSVVTLNNSEVTKFNRANNTGNNMSLLLLTDKSLDGFVKVFAGDRQVGLGYAKDGFCGIAVWGDDPTTEAIDGAREGEELRVANYELQGVVYTIDGFEVIDIGASSKTLPTRFELTSVYPNPFNSTTTIRFTLPRETLVNGALFDIHGRRVLTLLNRRLTGGYHTFEVDGSSLASGVYLIRLDTDSRLLQTKIALVK